MSEKFFSILDKLRQKSPEAKNAISFTISLIITLVIAGFWLVYYIDDAKRKLSEQSIEEIIVPIKDFSASVNGSTNDSF